MSDFTQMLQNMNWEKNCKMSDIEVCANKSKWDQKKRSIGKKFKKNHDELQSSVKENNARLKRPEISKEGK